MKCSKCGTIYNDGSKYCVKCGVSLEKNKKNILIIILLVIIVVLIISLIFVIINSKNRFRVTKQSDVTVSNTTKTTTTSYSKEVYTYNKLDIKNISKQSTNDNDINNNIEIYNIFFNNIKKEYGKYERAYIYGKNNNSEPIHLKIDLEYYDSDGYRIDRETSNAFVKANKEFVLDIAVKDDSLEYDTIKTIYEANKKKTYYTDIAMDESSFSSVLLNDKTIDINVTNSSNEKKSNGVFSCIYFKDKKVVFATNAYYFDLESGNTVNTTCYNSLIANGEYGNDLKTIDFDDYRVELFSAYDYDSVNY